MHDGLLRCPSGRACDTYHTNHDVTAAHNTHNNIHNTIHDNLNNSTYNHPQNIYNNTHNSYHDLTTASNPHDDALSSEHPSANITPDRDAGEDHHQQQERQHHHSVPDHVFPHRQVVTQLKQHLSQLNKTAPPTPNNRRNKPSEIARDNTASNNLRNIKQQHSPSRHERHHQDYHQFPLLRTAPHNAPGEYLNINIY